MSSTPTGAGALTTAGEAVGAITQQKLTYRRYVKFGDVDDGQGNISKFIKVSSIVSESDKKEPEKVKIKDATTGQEIEIANPYVGKAVSFANSERDGFEQFSENDLITYDIKSFEGAELLNPDPAIRLYIYKKGLQVFQNSLAQGIMKSMADGTTLTPEFNGTTVDLRIGTDEDGTNSINKAPARRAMTLDDKLYKQLIAAGKSEVEAQAILSFINNMSAASGGAGEGGAAELEKETVEVV